MHSPKTKPTKRLGKGAEAGSLRRTSKISSDCAPAVTKAPFTKKIKRMKPIQGVKPIRKWLNNTGKWMKENEGVLKAIGQILSAIAALIGFMRSR